MKRVDELGISKWPWTIDNWNDVNDAGGYTIASVMDSEGCNLEEEDANARLIAAAPEMYEALWTACSVVDDVLASDDMQANCHNGTVFKLSVAKKHMLEALAKASGEEVS